MKLTGRFVGMLAAQPIADVAWGPLDVPLHDLPPGTVEHQATLAMQIRPSGVVLVTTL